MLRSGGKKKFAAGRIKERVEGWIEIVLPSGTINALRIQREAGKNLIFPRIILFGNNTSNFLLSLSLHTRGDMYTDSCRDALWAHRWI